MAEIGALQGVHKKALAREDTAVKDTKKQLARLKSSPGVEVGDLKQLARDVNDHQRLADQIRTEFDPGNPKYPPTHEPQNISRNPHGLPEEALKAINYWDSAADARAERASKINKSEKSKQTKIKMRRKATKGMVRAKRYANWIRGEFGLPKEQPIDKPLPKESEKQS